MAMAMESVRVVVGRVVADAVGVAGVEVEDEGGGGGAVEDPLSPPPF